MSTSYIMSRDQTMGTKIWGREIFMSVGSALTLQSHGIETSIIFKGFLLKFLKLKNPSKI